MPRTSLQSPIRVDRDDPPITRSERVGYVLVTVLVIVSMALAVFA